MKKAKVMIIGHCGIGETSLIKKVLESNDIIVVDNKELRDLEKNQKDLKPEYAKLINDNFWDLI